MSVDDIQNRELCEAQAALEDSRARYAELYDRAPVAYFTVDRHGRITEANLTAATFFGGPRATIIGRLLPGVAGMADSGPFFGNLRDCLARGSRVTAELTLRHGDGQPTIVQAVLTPVEGEDGLCRVAFIDVTSLRRSQEKLEVLARASGLLAASFDTDTTIAAVIRLLVPRFADLCSLELVDPDGQLRRAALVLADRHKGTVADALRHQVTRSDSATPQARVLETGVPLFLPHLEPARLASAGVGIELDALLRACRPCSLMVVPLIARGRANGVMTWVQVESRRNFGPDELTLGRDLAARLAMAVDNARLYHEAEASSRLREEALAVVSHDLRNPLQSLKLGLATMTAGPEHADRRSGRKQLDAMTRSIERMDRMIEDLLDIASIDAGRLAIESAHHDANELLGEAAEVLVAEARAKDIALSVSPMPEQATVPCDRGRILQVFANLGANAIKFTGERTTIGLGVDVTGDEVRFRVSDQGPGVAPENLSRMFERHWQAPETARKGRGLGLFIARGIVHAQGGRIWAESEPGNGTTVYFTLPRFSVPKPPARSPAPRSDAILVVDDDDDSRSILAMLLEARGHQVVQAADGREALDWLRATGELPALILLDLQMPRMHGWDLMAALAADPVLSELPVIIMSSRPDVESEAVALGGVAALPKPIVVDELLRAVSMHWHPASTTV